MPKFKIGDKITYEGADTYCIIDEVEDQGFGTVKYWGLWYYKDNDVRDSEGRCYLHADNALPCGDTASGTTINSVQQALDFLISQGYTVSLSRN